MNQSILPVKKILGTLYERSGGEHGSKFNYKGTEHLHTTEKQRKQWKNQEHLYKLPKSDYKTPRHVRVPKEFRSVLLLSDIHFPYQDNEALELALDYGERNKVDAIYLNGDTMDFYDKSEFDKDPKKRDFGGELEIGRDFLAMLKSRFNVSIFFKIGNHEYRWERFLLKKAPDLLGVPDFELKNLLRFNDFGVKLIKNKQRGYIGKLPVMHGHEFGRSVFSPVNPARGLFLRTKYNGIIGHHHQSSEHTERNLKGTVISCFSSGCLCGLEPDYMPVNKWNHGFAHVTTDSAGNFKVDNIRIIKGEIV